MWTIKRFPAPWILPALIPVALLTIFPIAHALWTSLHQVMLLFPGEDWVGLDNYRNVVTGEYFGVALRNSLLFTVLSAPLVVALGTAVGMFLHREFFGVGQFEARGGRADPLVKLVDRVAGLNDDDVEWIDRLVATALARKSKT